MSGGGSQGTFISSSQVVGAAEQVGGKMLRAGITGVTTPGVVVGIQVYCPGYLAKRLSERISSGGIQACCQAVAFN